MPERLLLEMLVIVAASFGAVALLSRKGFSPIVGYLAVGLLVGPHGFKLVHSGEGVRVLGELGVAFLMFIVGLEFSLPRMFAARGVVFGLGSLQVAVTTLIAAGVAWAFGIGWLAGLIVGGALAMSSTAVAAKQLADQGELNTQHGQLALGILLFQDLAIVPFLVLVDALSATGERVGAFALRTVGIILFLAIALTARQALTRFMGWVASSRSTELFLLAALMLVLGAAAVAHEAGLSVPVGAFLAGMLVGESDLRHQLEEEIRPYRDVLLGLFFVSVGMAIDPRAIMMHPLLIPAFVAALAAGKTCIVFALVRGLGWANTPALRAGLVLGHGGELALVILTQALSAGLLVGELGQLILFGVAASIVIAPFLIQYNGRLAAGLGLATPKTLGPFQQESREAAVERAVAEAVERLSNHVILCGCGRVGRLVATVLEASDIPYIALERDPERLRLAQDQGYRAMFGDATRRGILEAAGLERAVAIVSTLPANSGTERLIYHVRAVGAPEVPIIVSTDDESGLGPLVEAGATLVLPENLAAGLGLAAQTLRVLGIDRGEVEARLEALGGELAPELRELWLPSRAMAREERALRLDQRSRV